MDAPLPEEIDARLAEFLKAGRTGNVLLDIKDGRIVAWKVTESGRVDTRRPVAA